MVLQGLILLKRYRYTGGGDQAVSAETSLRECYLQHYKYSRGHSLTKTEILRSAALRQYLGFRST